MIPPQASQDYVNSNMMRVGSGCNVSGTTSKLPDMCVVMGVCSLSALLMWNGKPSTARGFDSYRVEKKLRTKK